MRRNFFRSGVTFAWQSIPPHEPGKYLYAFLARITRHISLDRCRERNRLKRSAFICELSAEMEQCIPAPDDTECRMESIVLREAMNKFLDMLGAEKRNIFLRRYWYLIPYPLLQSGLACRKAR